MIFGSVCSGIEAASVAWQPLAWRASFVSEIEPFPRAVLEYRHGAGTANGPALHGDFTTIEDGQYEPIDLLVGGTPCQSFSIAGLRGGLDDDRGNLALEYLRLAQRLRPRWLVWENVPGVLSSGGGRDFGAILGGMVELGYGFAYRVLDAQYIRVDGFARAVPQRRRRVFVVGYLGDWRRAAAVLFERESLSGHPAPRRQTREGIAGATGARTRGGGRHVADVANTLNAHFGDKQGLENEHVNAGCPLFVAHTLRAEGFDASDDGTGRGTPLVPVAFNGRQDPINYGPVSGPIDRDGQTQCIAFSAKDHGADATEGVSPTLRAGGHANSHANAGVMPAVAIQERAVSENPDAGPQGKGWQEGAAYTLEARNKVQAVAFDMRGREGGAVPEGPHDTANIRAASGGSSRSYVAQTYAVRRLTPTECERLQGFPDGYTAIPWRGKPAYQCPDGPRYKALGNSMAVNAMRWIGERIAAVDGLTDADGDSG